MKKVTILQSLKTHTSIRLPSQDPNGLTTSRSLTHTGAETGAAIVRNVLTAPPPSQSPPHPPSRSRRPNPRCKCL
ncbi:hypothetical protein E2C01_075712 [Portunus trituberculatus]|uniref:Uncharacterized protein n=1 Tax=Portunus trituberculatus TaxID=210409 RepID=A0A5B7I6T1_PORTR|nr:hypothetical protein [Portunus trituberculatus]